MANGSQKGWFSGNPVPAPGHPVGEGRNGRRAARLARSAAEPEVDWVRTEDVAIVGGGIVGLATARALARSGHSVVVVEKEPDVGLHQTGHNSGVIHSGLYYRPGSLKADFCVRGRRMLLDFCDAEGVDVRRSGKVVVASDVGQFDALEDLRRRGIANGLRGLRRLTPGALQEVEPHVVGVGALHVPEAAVVDYGSVARRIADRLRDSDGRIVTDAPVDRVISDGPAVVVTGRGVGLRARLVINCAGLHADRLAVRAGLHPPVRIVPFRGSYDTLTPAATSLVRGLVYPVPDPRFPFLGVHLTRRIDGSVEVGPNALPALGREHYRGTRPRWPDVAEMLRFPGFRRLAARHWRTGLTEFARTLSRRRYVRAVQRMVPELRPDDLVTGGAGVRAQAVTWAGELVDDFSIVDDDRMIHVLNAPSPGATASLAIGEYLAGLAADRLHR